MPFLTESGPPPTATTGRVQYQYLSQAAIDSAVTGDTDIIYILNEAPYTKYFWNGSAMVNQDVGQKADAIPDVIYSLWQQAGGVPTPSQPTQARNVIKSADYTLESADGLNTRILAQTATSMKISVPGTSVIPVTQGPVTVIRLGGTVQIVPVSGVTLLPSPTINIESQYGVVRLIPIQTNTWLADVSANALSGVAPTNSVRPAISGTPTVGSTLTSTAGTWTVDGTKTYQWFADSVAISGATSTTYALQSAQIGKLVTCVVTNVVTGYPSVSAVSNGIVCVAAAVSVPQFSGLAVFTGVNIVGGSVTVTAPAATNSPTGYKFQRMLNGALDGSVTNQAGASLAWTITSGAAGKALTYSIIPYNGSGDGASITTQPFQIADAPIEGASPPVWEEFVEGSSASGISINLSKPSGTVDGDLLFLRVTLTGSAVVSYINSVSGFAGFTQLTDIVSGSGSTAIRLCSFWKIASSEPSSYTVNFSANVSHCASVARISNCSGVLGLSTATGTGVSMSIPALTTSVPNTLLYAEASQYEAAGVTFAPLAGWTNIDNQVPTPANAVSFIKTQTGAGSTGGVTIQGDGAGSADWVGRIIAFNPPASVGPPPPAPPPPPPPSPSTDLPGPRVGSFSTVGPIVAVSNQTISAVRINTTSGPCITVPAGVNNVTIVDCDLQRGRGEGNIIVHGSNVTILHCNITDGNRGVLVDGGTNVVTRKCVFTTFNASPFPRGTACEYDRVNGGEITENLFYGSSYPSDVISCYESSNLRLTGNYGDVNIAEPSSAAFTMGDSTTGNPGSNNYVAGNYIKQTGGGVPAGVFGSSGNTILEQNCFPSGIQAYNYSGVFVGVTVRNNAINFSNSFVPDTSVISGWSTNVNGSLPASVPGGLGWFDTSGVFHSTYVP